jgi:hypothetical protein
MSSAPGRRRGRFRPAVEAAAAGLGFGAALCFAGVCLLASFRPDGLSAPYWSGLPGLRSDTTGIAAFAVLAVCATVAEYLRLRRRAARPGPGPAPGQGPGPWPGEDPGPLWSLITALARVSALLSAALVIYLSVNAVTHPATLALHATHVLSWPAEGTLRAAALALAVVSAATCRYLAARAGAWSRPEETLAAGPALPRSVPARSDQPGVPRSTR